MNILENFEYWLKSQGYSCIAPSGQPSVVQSYKRAVKSVAKGEGLSVDELAKKIDTILPDYLPSGCKEVEGKKSHSSVSNALKRFKEFVDTQETLSKTYKTIDIDVFKAWLKQQRKSNGEFYSHNVVDSYLSKIRNLCRFENIDSLNELAININNIQFLYGRNGSKQLDYEKDHGATIAAINLFKRFTEEYSEK